MKKPLIGLTPSHNIDTDKIHIGPFCQRAIQMAQGIPIILPIEIEEEDLRQIVRHLDGVFFTGGADPHPFFFGEETLTGCGEISVKRDTMEIRLLRLAMEYRKPILGVCRGCQIINVALGGDIYQDLFSQADRAISIAHRQPLAAYGPIHTVDVTPGSLLSDICGSVPAEQSQLYRLPAIGADHRWRSAHMQTEDAGSVLRLLVNSSHHQAVRRLAPGISACATAPDGIIEGIEMKDYPFLLGVQWHPEYLWERDPAAARLFEAFVTACLSE